MIRSIRHKGLSRFYEDDDPRGVMTEHVVKLRDILARLDAARAVADMDSARFPASPAQGRIEGLLGGNGSGKLASDFSVCRP
jgi:proteic killer suppression protein